MSNRYQILFLIELRHDYFESKRLDMLEIVPTEETVTVIKAYDLLFKTGKGFAAVLTKTVAGAIPFKELLKDIVFNFHIISNTHLFSIITNTEIEKGKKLFYTNTYQNKVDNVLYLHKPIADYDPTVAYNIGDFAGGAGNSVYEALAPNGPGNIQALTQTLFWREKGNTPYSTIAEQIDVGGNIYNFPVNPAKQFDITIAGFNINNRSYDRVVRNYSLAFKDDQNNVKINLATLPPALYRISVNTSEKIIYKDEMLATPQVLGLVQIVNYLPATEDYSLTDSGGTVKMPSFIIHFANRSVIWKYTARTANVTTIRDSSLQYNFSNIGARMFTSNLPIPLTQKPLHSLVLRSSILGDVSNLANPPTNNLKQIHQNGHRYYCLETYLQY